MTAENEFPDSLLRSALDAMRDPFMTCASIRADDGTITGFRVLFANRAAELFMGQMPDTLTGTPMPDRIPYLGAMSFFDAFRRVVETGETWTADAIEFSVPAAGGGRRRGTVSIQAAASGDGFSVTFQDVSERELARRERDRLAAALDQATDGVIVVDLDGIVTYANDAFLASRGLVRDEFVGHDAGEFGRRVLGPEGHAAMLEALPSAAQWRRDVDYTSPDGTARRLEITVTPIRDATAAVTSFVVMSRDVTARHEARARRDRRRALAQAAAEVDRRLLHLTDPVAVAEAVCRAMVETGGLTMAWVGLMDPATGLVRLAASHGDTGYIRVALGTPAGTLPAEGAASKAVRTEARVVVDDISTSPMMAPWRDEARLHGLRSVAAFPLRHASSTRGVLVAYGALPDTFGPDEIATLEQIAADVGFVLTAIEELDKRRGTEGALARSERRFRDTLSDVAIAAVILDRDGRVRFANRCLLEMTGWEATDVIGQDWYERFTPPDERSTTRADDLAAIDQGTILQLTHDRLLTRSGEIREMEWSNTHLRDEASLIPGVARLGIDVTERLRAREGLEASEARLRTTIATIADAVAVATAVRDADGQIVDFRVDYSNAAIGAMSGVPETEHVGRMLLEMLPAHRTNGLFDAYVRVVETGEPYESGPFHYLDPDAAGGPLDQMLEHRAARMGDGYVVSIRDVGQRQVAQAALEASEQRLRTAMDTMSDGVAVLASVRDAGGRIVDFTFEYENPAIGGLSGVTPAEAAGRTLLKMFPAHATNGLFEACVRVVETGVPYESGAFRYVDPDAAGGPLDQVVEHRAARMGDGYVVSVRDVGERQAAQLAVEASEERLRTAFGTMLEGVAMLSAVRAADGQIVDFRIDYSNAAIGGISRVPAGEQEGRTLLELFPAQRSNGLFDAYVRVVETGEPFESGPFHNVDPDAAGGPLDQVVEHRAARMGDGYVMSVRDVTARQAAEDEVRRLNEELEQRVRDRTAKLEAANRELETFSYSVSHDLRSPLRAITGFAEILNRRYRERLDPKGRHYLDNIVEGGLHMGVLIDDLLAYSRLGRSRVHNEPVPLAPILDRLRTTLADQIRADGGMLAVAEPMAVPIGDPTLLEQILVNLLDNAVTYRRPEVPLQITVSAVREGQAVALKVTDNGIGIAPEHQARIMEPFVRLHTAEEYPGTGIGLATIRKAARLMGTDVTVSSTLGVGSTFTITLPAAPPAAPPAEATA